MTSEALDRTYNSDKRSKTSDGWTLNCILHNVFGWAPQQLQPHKTLKLKVRSEEIDFHTVGGQEDISSDESETDSERTAA